MSILDFRGSIRLLSLALRSKNDLALVDFYGSEDCFIACQAAVEIAMIIDDRLTKKSDGDLLGSEESLFGKQGSSSIDADRIRRAMHYFSMNSEALAFLGISFEQRPDLGDGSDNSGPESVCFSGQDRDSSGAPVVVVRNASNKKSPVSNPRKKN